ncbi:MAG TPA: hypothetical protein VFU57_11370 [Candidatus Acidoferrales bacterium]|nr:hypothetical protein [Candidatus Acidoferrales bacterium]
MNRPTPQNGTRPIRDAIVMSGWSWRNYNVPERVALALSYLGAKVLYCENPSSCLRKVATEVTEVFPGIFRLQPRFLGHRLNRIHLGLDYVQARMLSTQVQKCAASVGLRSPLFIYPHGEFFVPLCREFKKRGFPLVHCCFDYPERGQERHIELSDFTLTLSKSIFHPLRAKYGPKIAIVPQVRWIEGDESEEACVLPAELAVIPRPRLGYIGLVSNRLNLGILHQLLLSRPEWHFVHFGDSKCLPLANVHTIAWRDPGNLDRLIANLDIGFMPYNCSNNKDFHCMPLKVFDYFNAGVPVVSTPIVNLWEYSDTIYFGDTAEELITAVESALDEPADSPRRSLRRNIAKRQSISALAESLSRILFSERSARFGASKEAVHFESVGLRDE